MKVNRRVGECTHSTRKKRLSNYATGFRDHIDISTLHNLRQNYPSLYLHVLGLEEVGHVLGPRVLVLDVVVVMRVVVCRANVLHLVNGSALHAAGLRLFTGEGDPENVVRVGGVAGATDVLLVTS